MCTARLLRSLAVVLALAGAVAAAAFSAVSYAWLRQRADRFAVGGDAGITRDEFDLIRLRLRLAAVALAGGALVLVLARRRVDDVVSVVLGSWSRAVTSAPRRAYRLMRAQGPAFVVACAVVLAAAVAIRVAFLDVPMRYDEATTYDNFVTDPIYVSLADYATPNNHPLHTALAKLSVTLFGNDPTAVRLPALVAGLLLVVATFALGWVLYGRSAALLGAAFAAGSSTLVEYSTNARGYTLVALFTATGLLAAARIVAGGGIGAWAALVVSGALGAFAVPVMLYAFGGIAVWLVVALLLDGRAMRAVARAVGGCVAATGVLTAVLYGPILLASGPASLASNEFVQARSFGTLADELPGHAADTAETWVRDLPWAAGALLGVALLVSLALTPRLGNTPVPPLVAFAAWAIPVVAIQRVVPYTRVWLFALPVAIVTVAGLLGAGLDRLPRTSVAVPVVAVAIAVGCSAWVHAEGSVRSSRETGALLDAEAVADALRANVRPGDTAVATGSDVILQYYLERRGTDATFLYDTDRRGRVFVVVNLLGGQTLEMLEREAGLRPVAPPRLVGRWPSAELYVLPSTRAGAADG